MLQDDDDDSDGDGDDDGDCGVVRRRQRRTIPNRVNSFLVIFFFGRIEGLEKSGDMQANGKNVAGITVSTTQCLYVVR